MPPFIRIIVLFLLISPNAFAAVQPANGASLNHTQIMFEYDEVEGSTHYMIYIYPLDDAGNRINKKAVKIKNNSLAYIASLPGFGKKYTWYYEAFNKKKSLFKSPEYSFNVATHAVVDTDLFRSKVSIATKDAYHNGIVFLDYLGAAIDRQGNPVWFYPSHPTDGKLSPTYRNIRMTKTGSITFQDNSDCYDVDLEGNLIWKAPNDGKISGDATEYYHHDFRKMDDGTYMTSSYKYATEPNFFDGNVTSRVRYNTLIQYDAGGKVLWSWNEANHIGKDVIFKNSSAQETNVEGTHLNGFDYDPVDDALVLSFRNTSTVLKIDKKTGIVLYDLSIYNIRSRKQRTEPWTRSQHGPMMLPDHKVLIYNNNATDDTTGGPKYPKVLIVKEPLQGQEASKAWEFECRSSRYPNGLIGKEGYAAPLPNGNILVCMGGANYSFEVTPDKKVVWECWFEKYDDSKKAWTPFNNYRCNFASSLYPRHYTIQHGDVQKGSINIKVNNEGTDDDKYEVKAVLQNGYTNIYTDTISLKGRTEQTVNIPLSDEQKKQNILVFVTAVSNNANSKYFEYKKQE